MRRARRRQEILRLISKDLRFIFIKIHTRTHQKTTNPMANNGQHTKRHIIPYLLLLIISYLFIYVYGQIVNKPLNVVEIPCKMSFFDGSQHLFGFLFDYFVLKHLIMKFCPHITARGQERHGNEQLLPRFHIAEGGIFPLDFYNNIILRLHIGVPQITYSTRLVYLSK